MYDRETLAILRGAEISSQVASKIRRVDGNGDGPRIAPSDRDRVQTGSSGAVAIQSYRTERRAAPADTCGDGCPMPAALKTFRQPRSISSPCAGGLSVAPGSGRSRRDGGCGREPAGGAGGCSASVGPRQGPTGLAGAGATAMAGCGAPRASRTPGLVGARRVLSWRLLVPWTWTRLRDGESRSVRPRSITPDLQSFARPDLKFPCSAAKAGSDTVGLATLVACCCLTHRRRSAVRPGSAPSRSHQRRRRRYRFPRRRRRTRRSC